MNGYVQPLPGKTARGAYDFQPQHLRQLRDYLVHVRPGPRPQLPSKLPIEGENDRMKRLQRAKLQRDETRARAVEKRSRRQAADATIRWLEELSLKEARLSAES